jgi:hypothetical protein
VIVVSGRFRRARACGDHTSIHPLAHLDGSTR